MKYRLKKDIIFKAGTVLENIDGRKSEWYEGNYSKLFGLTDNSYGELIYSVDENDPALAEFFESVEE